MDERTNTKTTIMRIILSFCVSCTIIMVTWFYTVEYRPSKDYPINVEVCYETHGYWYTNTIECDSIKGDTIFKDKLTIVNKNIVNVTFK